MSATHGLAIIVADAVFMAVSTAAVALRFWVRKSTSMALAADDWLIVAAWFFASALAITNIIAVPVGHFGSSFDSLSPDDAIAFLKFWFTIQFFYIFAVATIKLSVLYFYRRVFSVVKTPKAIWVLVGLTAGWLISFFFATLFQVYPIWCNWILCPATADFPVIFVMCSVTDILLDIAILSLPAFFIWRLQISSAKKVGIIGVFGLGLFCIVASIARLVYTVEFLQANMVLGDLKTNFDVSRDNTILWSGIEACFSTACANLPCYAPLIFNTRRESSYNIDGRSGASGGARATRYGSSAKKNTLTTENSSNGNNRLSRIFSAVKHAPSSLPSRIPSKHRTGRPQRLSSFGDSSSANEIAVEETVEIEFSDRRPETATETAAGMGRGMGMPEQAYFERV